MHKEKQREILEEKQNKDKPSRARGRIGKIRLTRVLDTLVYYIQVKPKATRGKAEEKMDTYTPLMQLR